MLKLYDLERLDQPKYLNTKCGGLDFQPKVGWKNVPTNAKSIALVLHDPDAPVSGGWIHWLIFNIPITASNIPGSSDDKHFILPEGSIVAKNSYGNYRYNGACPPPGKLHHYNLHLFALDTELPMSLKNQPLLLYKEIQKHTIVSDTITSTYQTK